MPVIPPLKRLGQEDPEFEASLNLIIKIPFKKRGKGTQGVGKGE